MVTKRFLRWALLGLLGFMVFCLVVMEITLHGKQWTKVYRHLVLNHSRQAAVNATSSPTIGVNATSPSNLTSKGFGEPVHHSSRSGQGKPVNASGEVLSTPKPGSTPTSQSLALNVTSVDYCQDVGATAASGAFSLKSQKLADGSRPQNCSHCFYSRFPALLQSCRVCNTAGGGADSAVDIVMTILTTHGAADKRQAIRRTWASVTRNNTAAHVRHVFVLGRSRSEADRQRVREEHRQHGDIVMYDFLDSYANLTLKTLTCLHWALDYCHRAKYILKADDDMWINVPTLLATVRREASALRTAIGGACHASAGPIRNRHSKWYASKKDYPQDSYPGFCSGTSYVTSLNVARRVVAVSPDVPFFYLEDVYMALCIKRLGPPFRLHRLGGFFHGGGSPCVLRGAGTVTVHEVRPSRLVQIWEAKCP